MYKSSVFGVPLQPGSARLGSDRLAGRMLWPLVVYFRRSLIFCLIIRLSSASAAVLSWESRSDHISLRAEHVTRRPEKQEFNKSKLINKCHRLISSCLCAVGIYDEQNLSLFLNNKLCFISCAADKTVYNRQLTEERPLQEQVRPTADVLLQYPAKCSLLPLVKQSVY